MSNYKTISIILIGGILIGGYLILRTDVLIQRTAAPQVAPPSVDGEQAPSNINNARGYYDIGSAALIEILGAKDFALINVHTPYEGELPETDAFIPYNAIRQNLGRLPSGKNAKIVLYCRSGSMSAVAAKELATLGYTNVYNLAGGMNEWEKEGNAVIRK